MPRLEANVRRHFAPPAGREHRQDAGFQLDVILGCEAGITVLFGASGAGKTLTLDALAGFYKPEHGRIVLDDAILFDAQSGVCLPPQKRHVGYVFQNYALFPHLTVEENLAFGIQHLPALERGRRIHEHLARFGIDSKLKRLPRELSGGEKQRASIARALICQPKLLLLDEPVRGLDNPLRADFYEILRQVRAEYQLPILLVTHDSDEAYMLADRIAVFENGRIAQFAAPDEVFERPTSASIAKLLGIANIFRGTIESLDPMAGVTQVRAEGLCLTLPYLPGRLRGDQLEFCIRKESLLLSAIDAAAPKTENVFAADVISETFSPGSVQLTLALDCGNETGKGSPARTSASTPASTTVALQAELSRQQYHSLQLDDERSCRVQLPSNAVHVFPVANVSADTPTKT